MKLYNDISEKLIEEICPKCGKRSVELNPNFDQVFKTGRKLIIVICPHCRSKFDVTIIDNPKYIGKYLI